MSILMGALVLVVFVVYKGSLKVLLAAREQEELKKPPKKKPSYKFKKDW